MLSQYFEAPERIRAIRSGPLGALIEGFAEQLFQRGYSKISARRTHSIGRTLRPLGNPPGPSPIMIWMGAFSSASVITSADAVAVAIVAPIMWKCSPARDCS